MRAALFRIFPAVSPGLLAALWVGLFSLGVGQTHAAGLKQHIHRTFDSPETAVNALVGALKSGVYSELAAILGDPRLTPRDQQEDRADVEGFLKSYELKHSLDKLQEGRAVLSVGSDGWRFPVPIILKGEAWRFDTKAGMREIFNRRIGRNELMTIESLKAYVAAQREYAAKHPDAGGTRQFACRFVSQSSQQNGLYRKPGTGDGESPLGELIAQAASEECQATGLESAAYHGYYYKILTRQGTHAPGGSYDYMVNGSMVLGFACVAYPENYGRTGVMTFIVNQAGVVYQKDLGKKTAAAAKTMRSYDPDATWAMAE